MKHKSFSLSLNARQIRTHFHCNYEKHAAAVTLLKMYRVASELKLIKSSYLENALHLLFIYSSIWAVGKVI